MLARILIADDHPAVRATIRMLLDWHSFQVCGDAKDGKEAIDKVIELKPDIVLLDIKMPEMTGLEAAYEIQRIAPSTKIVFFTVYDSPQLVGAMHIFSNDFVPKSAAGTELIPTLNRLVGVSSGKPRDNTIEVAPSPNALQRADISEKHPAGPVSGTSGRRIVLQTKPSL